MKDLNISQTNVAYKESVFSSRNVTVSGADGCLHYAPIQYSWEPENKQKVIGLFVQIIVIQRPRVWLYTTFKMVKGVRCYNKAISLTTKWMSNAYEDPGWKPQKKKIKESEVQVMIVLSERTNERNYLHLTHPLLYTVWPFFFNL